VTNGTNKKNIIKDFTSKDDYYEKNYLHETPQNYLRRTRNILIRKRLKEIALCERVLDVGCGPEILYPELLDSCKKYYAMDLVQANLDRLGNKHKDNKKIEYLLDDLDYFEFEHNYFDAIVCSGAIEYTNKPYDNFLKLIHVLRNGGVLLCSFPNGTSPYRIWSEYVYKHFYLLKKKLSGDNLFRYSRNLFNVMSFLNKSSGKNLHSVNVVYLGYKFIPQPFDRLLASLDYRIIKHFQEHPVKLLEKYCTEFIIEIKK
jgi:SAM-dependent methyltransferase